MESNKIKRLATIPEVAEMLNVKLSWVRKAIFKKEIPYIKVGNQIRFRNEDLKKWVEGNRVEKKESRFY